ncbi:MAG: WXG100 family type VII secretion target [Synergistaceae bacterium]|jgi:WXG100 family type VII secretion target|nr:WXG100 family type VII secretion target [Synergistaceae bacterium]
MALIKVTPETLHEQAKQLISYDQEHNDAYAKMQKLVENITTVWEGEAQTAFRSSFDAKRSEFQKFSTDIQAFAKLMDNAADKMAQTEAELKSSMTV